VCSFPTAAITSYHELGGLKKKRSKFQDGGEREEAESMTPIVKSWKDAGDTPCRQNHREEAKL
jgi:hypothetical protein